VKIRFQADNDLRSAIRTGVIRREPSIDFRTAHEAQLDGIPDQEVLRIAADRGRILVSHDENSMPSHFRVFLAEGNRSPGIWIVPQRAATAAVIESVLLAWVASDAEEWQDRITWLPF
jgi:hypothetical protein